MSSTQLSEAERVRLESDIAIVMDQTRVSRGRAEAALETNEGDIVNAIMELSFEPRSDQVPDVMVKSASKRR